jgi:RHS repeat-associated protein
VRSHHGRWIEFTYDGSNRITQAKDNGGRTVGYTYDTDGRVWKVTDPANGVTEYTYDTSHRMLTIKDARGIVFLTNHYDANGRVDLQTQADTTTYQFAYTVDGTGKVTQTDVTNPRGYTTRLTFNGSNEVISRVEALGTSLQRTTTWTRDAATNQVTRMTDGLGRHTDYAYDSLGNTTSVTRLADTSDAVTATYEYAPIFSLLTSVTDPLEHTTTLMRDGEGNVTSVVDALQHETTLTYTPAGQPLTVTTPAGMTQFGYDGGDLVSATDPLGRTSTRFVDALGRLRRVTSPLGQVSRHTYDALNAVTDTLVALGGQTEFTYDENRNLLTLTDALDHTTAYGYNNMDRVETRTDPLMRGESYVYDENGNLEQVTDRKNQVTTYAYDALDRLSTVTYQGGSTTTYTYDAGDRLTQIVDSIAGTITRGWDLLDRLTSETTSEGNVSYTYDDADRRATMTVAGQPQVTYGYDDANRLTSITQGSATVGFAYDDADRRTVLTLPNGVTVEYGYDDASQVTDLTYKLGTTTLGTLTYSYDLAGNQTAVGGTWARTGLPPALASATYDAANQIATWGATTFSYDANGNLTNDGAKTYTWNPRNQLTALSGGVSASFQYDALGRRRAKTVSGASTSFLYDGLNTVQELVSGSPSANILPGLGIDEWLTRTDSAGTRYLLTDVLGSTLALSNGSGVVQTEYTYEPFGKTTVSGASSSSALQFTGRENDGTGLFYYRARYYDPMKQRFTGEDPLGVAGGLNLFTYVGNTPALYVDPLGLKPSSLFGPGPNGRQNAPPERGPGPVGPSNTPSSKPDPIPPVDDPHCPGGADGWWKPSSHEYIAGRRGHPVVPPGGTIGRFIEDHIPAGHAFATRHDAVNGDMVSAGYPDWFANIPTMPIVYAYEVLNQFNRTSGSGTSPFGPACHR